MIAANGNIASGFQAGMRTVGMLRPCHFSRLLAIGTFSILNQRNIINLSVKSTCGRYYSSKKYSKTLNLPQTTFELWGAGKREPDVQKVTAFEQLYSWQQSQKRERKFSLHDGPPYANGNPHVGHAVNKILKDVMNRYKLLQGYKVEYVPGWDCHGLPVELKAISNNPSDFSHMTPLEIRSKARAFALEAVAKQMEAFRRWGVMADWDNCYYTFNKEFEANQLQLFYDMYKKGLIYRELKPVNWSPSSRTALAEAELEYNPNHISPSVYVKFPIKSSSHLLSSVIGEKTNISVLIWTTTPWTLPANQAICFMPSKEYSLVQFNNAEDWLIIATERLEEMKDVLKIEVSHQISFQSSALDNTFCQHPTIPDKVVPLLHASHVKMNMGTGLVHTAPSHGTEDYNVGLEHKLSLDCIVDSEGVYTEDAGPVLAGKNVLTEGNDIVIEQLQTHGNLVHKEDYEHSYPYDWRTKQPVITRASQQWFIDTEALKDKAIECLKQVKMIPEHAMVSMVNQLKNRPFWCISRQRVWGVPIPVFYEKETGDPFISSESIKHIVNMVKKHGTDCWWTMDIDQLLPREILEKSGSTCMPEDFDKGEDILDIWFDSGSSWSHVLQDKQADVYVEGIDQYGAWFQTSLLTSVAVQDKAPYKSLLVHGFTLDGEGRKMSKSLGNVVDPDVIINGGKNKKKKPAYGADVLRWTVAEADWTGHILMSPEHFSTANQHVLKIRNTIRYFLGNLEDFDSTRHSVPYELLFSLDQYVLHLVSEFLCNMKGGYENYRYLEVTSEAVQFANKLSALYLDTVKDRLYCDQASSSGRRSCQTVLCNLLQALSISLAPVLPHLAEETFLHSKLSAKQSVFKGEWFQADSAWHNDGLAAQWESLLKLREAFLQAIPPSKSREYDVTIHAQDAGLLNLIRMLQSERNSCTSQLTELLMSSFCRVSMETVSNVQEEDVIYEGTIAVLEGSEAGNVTNANYTLHVQPASHQKCQRCRKFTAPMAGQPCNRCIQALADGWE